MSYLKRGRIVTLDFFSSLRTCFMHVQKIISMVAYPVAGIRLVSNTYKSQENSRDARVV